MRRLASYLTLLSAAINCGHADTLYPGYDWQSVGRGIYLASATDPLAGPVDGNSVVIDYGAGILVVDTHINPAVARAVIGRIRSDLGKPVTHVLNTHWHDDHTNGNHAYRSAYPGAVFVAHRATLDALKREWQAMEDERTTAYASIDPDQLRETAATLDDPSRAMGYRLYADYVEALKPELPALQLVYPDTVFDEDFAIDGDDRRIEARWLGRGNTDGDIVVVLPDDDMMITGDLLVWPVPFAFDSPMTDWVETLNRLSKIDAGTVIPGHGPIQHDSNYIGQVLALLRDTLSAVRDAHDRGVTFDGLADAVDLAGHEARFTRGDSDRVFAWHSYFLEPGLKSAWTALAYPLPDE